MAAKNNAIDQLKGMLAQYLDTLGLPTGEPFNCVNPNHEDRNPSMSFNPKDNQHVHCYGCGANWDIFDLIAIKELGATVIDGANGQPEAQYRFSDAYNKAIQLLGIDAKPMSQSEQKRPENEQESQLKAKINETNAQIIQGANKLLDATEFDQLKNPSPEQIRSHKLGLEYLQKR